MSTHNGAFMKSSPKPKKSPPRTKPSTPVAPPRHSSPLLNDNNNNNNFIIETRDTKSEWELTWPIWHMLPRDERKAIAIRHGMKTIGEFEEYMSLHKAEEVSSSLMTATTTRRYGSLQDEKKSEDETEENHEKVLGGVNRLNRKMSSTTISDDDEDEDTFNECQEPDTATTNASSSSSQDLTLNQQDLIQHGGPILTLPEELLHKIMSFLDIDYYHVASLVHPSWSTFTRTEHAYKLICTRCYLNQSKRKTLKVQKFQNSYRIMLQTRPRVKTGGGLYVLKYHKIKKIERDMWTEVPVGAILESVYYRYLYFGEDGRVLYALTCVSPKEMIRRILNVKRTGEKDKYAIWGRYEVSKFGVKVWARHDWCHVLLEMKIVPGGVEGCRGKFWAMSLERHRTSDLGDFSEEGVWRGDVVEHKVPGEYFRFLRDWRL